MTEEDNFILSKSKIAIIGLGLMGGSLSLALQGKCAALYGIDSDDATLKLARRQNIFDRADGDPADLLPYADVIILATPVPAIMQWILQLPTFMPNPCIILDVGSTKRLIVEAMSGLPERFDPIGGHPICGKEKLSLVNAERALYHGTPFLLVPLERTSSRALSAAHQIIQAVGAHATVLNALEHDRIIAYTSHLPFVLSSALALATKPDIASFIGPGFKSTSRLAGTPSSMMTGILQSNRENVITAIQRFHSALNEIESALGSTDDTHLQLLLNKASDRYAVLMDGHL